MTNCNLFLGSPSVSFAALIGDKVIRVKNGKLHETEHRPIYVPPIDDRGIKFDNFFSVFHREIVGSELIINIETGIGAFEISHYDEPLSGLPIGDKRVDDCTIEELLFAVKHKLTK